MPCYSSPLSWFLAEASGNNWKTTTLTNVWAQIINAEHIYPPRSAKTRYITTILQVARKPYCSTVSLNMNAAYGQKPFWPSTVSDFWRLRSFAYVSTEWSFEVVVELKDTKVPGREYCRRSHGRDSICSSKSYSAKSCVMITQESHECAFFTRILNLFNFNLNHNDRRSEWERKSVLRALSSIKKTMSSITHRSLVPLTGKHIKVSNGTVSVTSLTSALLH